MRYLDLAISDFWRVVQADPHNKDERLVFSQALFDAEKFNEAIEGIRLLDVPKYFILLDI